jgi:hypothetical protein
MLLDSSIDIHGHTLGLVVSGAHDAQTCSKQQGKFASLAYPQICMNGYKLVRRLAILNTPPTPMMADQVSTGEGLPECILQRKTNCAWELTHLIA